MSPKTNNNHIIILVHGIRTFGAWQNRFAELLKEKNPNIKIHIYKYGYFSSFAFLMPFFRMIVVRRFRKYLRGLKSNYPSARIDILAHSFGTYVTAYALKGISSDDIIPIHSVVFCGSVLKQLFPWNELVGGKRPVNRVINDCGKKDIWPAISQLFVIGMGNAGRRGFTGVTGIDAGIVNRYFDTNHSGFFEQSFMKYNWLPLFLDPNYTIKEGIIPPSPRIGAVLENYADPIKLFFLIVPFILIFAFIQNQRLRTAEAEIIAAAERIKAEQAIVDSEKSKVDAYKAKMKAAEDSVARVRAEEERNKIDQKRKDEEALRILTSAPGLTAKTAEDVLFDAVIAEKAELVSPSLPVQQTALNMITKWVDAQLDDWRRWEKGGWGWDIDQNLKPLIQEEVPPRHNDNGRYTILRTKSIQDYEQEYFTDNGEAFILDNSTLKLINLDVKRIKSDGGKRKLYFAGFNKTSSLVLLSRQYNVEIYNINGEPIDEFYVTSTKDPISFVCTLKGDSLLLIGDTIGYIFYSPLIVSEKDSRRGWRGIGSVGMPVVTYTTNPEDDTILMIQKKGSAYLWTEGYGLTEIPHGGEVTCCQFFPKNNINKFLTTGKDGKAKLWTWTANNELNISLIKEYTHPNQAVRYSNFSDDGSLILTITDSDKAFFWGTESIKPYKTLTISPSLAMKF